MTTKMLDYAVELARNGWRVLPVNGKVPAIPKWPEAATRDEEQVRAWWGNGLAICNIGIATGRESDLVVLDIDTKYGGEANLVRMIEKYGPLPETIEVKTPSGGRHIYLRYPKDGTRIGNATKLAGYAGVDVRGDGGQVVAPPSVGANGIPYQWISTATLAEIPGRWLPILARQNENERPTPAPTPGSRGKLRHRTTEFIVAGVHQGERNARLFEAAAEMAGGGYTIEEASVKLWLGAQSCRPPMDRAEFDATVASAFAKPRTPWVNPEEIELSQRGDTGNGALPVVGAETGNDADLDEVMRQKAGRTLTDTGNGERFARQWRGRVLWCPRRGWLVWDGRRFQDDDGQGVEALGVKTARAIYMEAGKAKDAEVAKALAAWAHKSEQKARIDAMISMSRHLLTVSGEELDADQFALNVENGTIDLRNGTLRPHDPKDRCTKIAPVRYDPEATAPRFLEFIRTTFNDDEALIAAVQRQLGLCLTGDVSEQALFIYYGRGANGKSSLLDLVQHLLGEYAATAPPGLLTTKRHEQHPCELAALEGKRLVISSETEAGQTLKLSLVKQLTGDAAITARQMRQDFRTFQRTHKLVMMTNNRPRIPENTEAAWRRIWLLPFDHTIPEDERDPRLLDKLKAEGAGVLNWLIAGCLAWQRKGLGRPDAVRAATETYRREQDVVGEFIAEKCITDDPTRSVSRNDLFKAFSEWCEKAGERKPTRQMLYEYVRVLDGVSEEIVKENGKTVRKFSGIGTAF